MKQAIVCTLCMVVFGLGSYNVWAENQLSAETTSEIKIDTNTAKNIDKNIEKSLPEKNLLESTNTEKPLTNLPMGDAKVARPKPGEFAVMSQPDVGTGIIQVTFGLFVVLLIIAGAAWFTRRFGHFQATAGGTMRIVGGLHLGTREKLVVVQVGEEQLLLGVAPGRVSTLHVLSKPLNNDELVSNRTQQGSGAFIDKLNAVLKKGR